MKLQALFRFLIGILIFLTGSGCSRYPTGGYKIGRDKTWALSPFDGRTEGVNAFTNALMIQISEEERVPLELIDVSPLNLIPWLQEGKYEGILAALPMTTENLAMYQFSDSILSLGPVLVVKEDSSITSLEDLNGKIVGVYAFDESVLVVQNNSTVIIQSYAIIPEALDDLVLGHLDAVVIPNLEAHNLIPTRYSGLLRIASSPLTDKGIRLITIKNKNTTFSSLMDRGLKQLRKSSLYLCLRAKFIF